MLHWNTAYLHAINELREDCLVIRYEDFCDDPAGTLAKAGNFCGMTPREVPKYVANRHAEIVNTNAKYFQAFPKKFHFRARLRAWEIFGYDLGEFTQ